MSVKSFVSKFSNWCSVTMLSGKTVKLVLYEVLQFAALVVPVFVIMERFASLMHNLKRGNETVYWLVVAASIAYVTSATLLVWVPLKYITLKRRSFSSDIRQWWVLLGVCIYLVCICQSIWHCDTRVILKVIRWCSVWNKWISFYRKGSDDTTSNI